MDDDDFVNAFLSVDPAPGANTVYLIRSCGCTPVGRHALGGLPPSSTDFADFRGTGPRADTGEPAKPSSIWHIRG